MRSGFFLCFICSVIKFPYICIKILEKTFYCRHLNLFYRLYYGLLYSLWKTIGSRREILQCMWGPSSREASGATHAATSTGSTSATPSGATHAATSTGSTSATPSGAPHAATSTGSASATPSDAPHAAASTVGFACSPSGTIDAQYSTFHRWHEPHEHVAGRF